MQLDGRGLAPLSGGKTAQLVILLHGVAANGNDLLYLARAWQKLLPEAEFIAPHAPFPCDYAPDGCWPAAGSTSPSWRSPDSRKAPRPRFTRDCTGKSR